jgi:CRP-like cAMP-binding protein
MVGLPLIVGVDSASFGAMVQMEGTALRIGPTALRQAFNGSEALRNRLLRYMQALHVQISQTAVCNKHHSLEERLTRWLLMAHDRAGEDQFPMTHEFMSLMLGVRRASVSVTANILKQAGLIYYRNGRMTVLDRAGLEDAGCECYGYVQRQLKQLLGERLGLGGGK